MEDWLVQIVVALVVGIVIGGIARILLPGAQRVGLFFTIAAGALAAYLGHYIAEALGLATSGRIDWAKLGIQVVLAMLVIGVVGGVGRQRSY